MPVVHLNDIDTYYERYGDHQGTAPKLLFVNGSGATLAASQPMLSLFAKQFDLVAHDQRGLGLTSIPDGPYTMAQYAADAAALVEHLGWHTYSVVGVSFGGMVAQELAVTFPQCLERLALVCTSPGGAGGSSYPLHTLASLDPVERAEIGLRILDQRFTPEWLDAHPGDRMLSDAMAQRGGEKPAEVLRGETLQLQARSTHDVYDRLPVITCPTLVASGLYDGIAPASNGEAIAAQISGAEFRAYEGGHAFFYQDRTAFPDVIEFLLAR